jgi:hypothetical protein
MQEVPDSSLDPETSCPDQGFHGLELVELLIVVAAMLDFRHCSRYSDYSLLECDANSLVDMYHK